MRNKRAFWMTLLVYAFAGPLVGLLSIVVIGFVFEVWGPIIDRLEALIPRLGGSEFLLNIVPHTAVSAFTEGNVLQVVFLPVLFAFGLLAVGPRAEPVIEMIEPAPSATAWARRPIAVPRPAPGRVCALQRSAAYPGVAGWCIRSLGIHRSRGATSRSRDRPWCPRLPLLPNAP
jgi:hypothetical protein